MARTITTQIDIDAPRAVVWSVLTDLASYADWNPLIVSSEGRVAEGERLTNLLAGVGNRESTFRPTVTEVEDGRVFEWLGSLGVRGLFDGRHRFELVDVEGGTRLHHGETFTGLLVPIVMRMTETDTIAGFEAMNSALQERAELVAAG